MRHRLYMFKCSLPSVLNDCMEIEFDDLKFKMIFLDLMIRLIEFVRFIHGLDVAEPTIKFNKKVFSIPQMLASRLL